MNSPNANPRDPNQTRRSDSSLLRRFRKGEEDAATALYVRYAKRLQALAKAQTSPDLAGRFDPEDVVQSVFLTFFRRAFKGYYEVPHGEELWQLLLIIALNKVRTLGVHHRAKKRDVTQTHGSDHLQALAGKQAQSDDMSMQMLRISIDEVLADLTESQQQTVELRIEGHDVATIAKQTGRSKRTVERILQMFRVRLTELVHEESDDDHSDLAG
jgi:RNA polymerase sigma-70 factor (ECF subfamily)